MTAQTDIVRSRAERLAIVISPFQSVEGLATEAVVRTYQCQLTLSRPPRATADRSVQRSHVTQCRGKFGQASR